MKIIGIAGYHITLPVEGSANNSKNQTGTYLVKVATDGGLVGYGECPTAFGARGLLKLAGENILGADPTEVLNIMDTQLLGKENALTPAAVNPNLKMSCELSAVEFALLDIVGKSTKLPVKNFLGGPLRKKVALADRIGQMPVNECLRRVEADIAKGIKTITLNISANGTEDIELLRELRNRFGMELIIRLDAGGTWESVPEAARILSRMEPFNIQYVQDALNRSDGESFKRLRDVTGIPMAAGKAFSGNQLTAREARVRLMELIRDGVIDVLAINPAEAGGLNSFTKLAAMCNGASVNIVVGNARGGISQAIWVTACIVCKSTAYAHDILLTGMPGGVSKDISAKAMTYADGYIQACDEPGFGAEPDWDVVKTHCISIEQIGDIK